MLWGIDDESHNIVGTTFDPDTEKVGNQPLQMWLAQKLSPSIAFAFRVAPCPEGRVVLLELPAATSAPVAFEGTPYIRIGSATPKLTDYPERYQKLVEVFQLSPPLFREDDFSTQVILYGPRKFAKMSTDERIRACYHHAVLKFLSGDRMKNSTLCERFGIEKRNAAQATTILNKTLDAGLIKVADPEHPRAGYIPGWA